MARIYKRLSKHVQAGNLAEVLITLREGVTYYVRAKSGIFVTPDNFKDGEIVVNRRKVGNDVKFHEQQKKKLNDLESHIYARVRETPRESINSNWLKLVVEKFNHPDKDKPEPTAKPTFYELVEEYLSKKEFSYDHTKAIRVVARDVARYEGFIRATDKARKDFTFDVESVQREDIEDFLDYLRNEYDLSQEYPKLFERLLKDYPVGIRKGASNLVVRGNNTLVKLAKKLKAFFRWLYDSGKIINRPFEGITIGTEKYGTPYYITIAERNKIAETDFGSSALNTQRDIFVFHCFIGCRVGDLIKLTKGNITNGLLVYTPHKTKDENESVQARVPLHPKALELITRYKGKDEKGRLFPFISPQKYNEAIKRLFTIAEITRNVEVRNPKTGENEIRPINEIASSHLARRTFIGNAYFKVADPNLISAMSGHVQGSEAFARYRKIEDEQLINVINQIG